MRAQMIETHDAPLVLRDIPRPAPGPGELLLRVEACGLNFADTLMVKGTYQDTPPLPAVPGLEVCGIVEDTGADAEPFSPGTRVAAYGGGGGLAEYVALPAARCVRVPDTMAPTEAAGFLVAYGTSDLALRHRARLEPGETLLVLGAGGGVGLTAVEIGTLLGARVIAVARGQEKHEAARAAGAGHVLASGADLRAEVKALGGADVVYDPVGGAAGEAAFRATREGARVLTIGFASGDVPALPANIALVKNIAVHGVNWGAYTRLAPEVMTESFRTLFAWHEAGKLSPRIGHVLPLERANDGLDLLRTRRAIGKVVIEIA